MEMECEETDVNSESKIEVEKNDSADNFQRFIYELFDKNGILNDLRAYLRGHIVNVLKSAQTGEPPLCQKNFTQRLQLISQALNMLIAEYLLQMDFTYTLSVFVSEIPLANMVFDFAKTLLEDKSNSPLKFKDCDVWSVLNYLGVKCDSEYASNIVEMYKSEERVPLLFCILKCMPMYRKESVCIDGEMSSHDSLTSSANSIDTVDRKAKVHRHTSCHQNCKHYNFCRACQNRILRLKEKYRDRKKDVRKETRTSSDNPVNVENFMKNVNVMEKRIIDEMFEQLQSVYEAEVELVRREEESRVRRTLASHAMQLQQRQEEIEQSLKSKQASLECRAHDRKQFLCGVARTLREQHGRVARAAAILVHQENNLKAQLSQAEETLRTKAEEMRVQISKELEILEGHLEAMKRERESLNKERAEFENLKSLCESKTRLIEARGEKEKEDLKQHYAVLKDEIAVLKKYIESTKEPKCVIETSTITDYMETPCTANNLNNTSRPERSGCDVTDREARPANRLVNDLKKQKNVNFIQSNLDPIYQEVSGARSRSESSDERASETACAAGGSEQDTIRRLVEENESLRDYARQQREHISSLWGRRPRTAPAVLPAANYFTVHRGNPSSSMTTFGWRAGAGEELTLFPPPPPATTPLHPSDPLPFVGMMRDRHVDSRRQLINQWRALKRRSSPLSRISRVRPAVPIQRETGTRRNISPTEGATDGTVRIDGQSHHHTTDVRQETRSDGLQVAAASSRAKAREKSPKTVLKEAKENLRTKNRNQVKERAPLQKRDKSPNSMLREAKQRLRKLEIEAQAVEKSYLDFRKRQAELKEERKSLSMLEERLNTDIVHNLDVSRSRSSQKFHDNDEAEITLASKELAAVTSDFDKYLRDYQTKYDIGETHFKNKNTARAKAKPIPIAYSDVDPKKDKRKNIDYLETPMMEFRKLYHAEKERNLSRIKPIEGLKPGVAEMHDYNKKLDINKEDEDINMKKTEQEMPENNSNLQDNDNTNDKMIVNNSFDEINLDKNNSNDTQGSQNFEDSETKLDSEEIPKEEQYRNLETLRQIKMNKAAELQILKDNINKIYNFKSPPFSISPVEEALDTSIKENLLEKTVVNSNQIDNEEKNVLRVEVESSYEVNKVKMSESEEGELVFVVQSLVTTKESNGSEENVPMTINISPKPKERTGSKDYDARVETPKSRSDSPEKAAQLTRNDVLDAIFHADDNKDVSSVDMHLELSMDNVKEDLSDQDDKDKDAYADYPDDFSADVDNYNSPSEFGNNSPISLPKSDNDNFWDN